MTDDQRGLYIWLDERLQQVATAQSDSHGRLRADMTAGFSEMRAQFSELLNEARALHDRTLIIETERSMERRAGIKVGVIYGAMAGAITSAIVSALIRSIVG